MESEDIEDLDSAIDILRKNKNISSKRYEKLLTLKKSVEWVDGGKWGFSEMKEYRIGEKVKGAGRGKVVF